MTNRPHIRESDVVRASILDAVVQLGALDNNNPITEWMFKDPTNPRSTRKHQFLSPEHGSLANITHGGRQYATASQDAPSSLPFPPPPLPPNASTQQPTSKLSSKISGAFRSRSKSRSRSSKKKDKEAQAEGKEAAGYETDEGYTSSSPSKSKRRLFASRSIKTVDSRDSESSPVQENAPSSAMSIASASDTRRSNSPSLSKTKSFRVFGRKRREAAIPDEGIVSLTQQAEDLPPSVLGPLIDEVLSSASSGVGVGVGSKRRGELVEEGSSSAGNVEAPVKVSRRLSFAIPRAALKNPFSERRKNIRRPPSLLPVTKNNASFGEGNDAHSLPPSPFILVAPEVDHLESSGLTTPYILCSPLDDLLPAQLADPIKSPNTPVYPISVSSIRRSLVMDNMDFTTTAGGAPALKRSMSLQVAPKAAFTDEEEPGGLAGSKRESILGRSYTTARRGREAPFPTRPVLPLPLSLTMQGANARAVRLSLDARASVLRQRYRESYSGGAGQLNTRPPPAFV